jgi:bifunctional non-homologous end joining protein LigD
MATTRKRAARPGSTEKKSSSKPPTATQAKAAARAEEVRPSKDRLSTYRSKRHFDVTPEPAPEKSSHPSAAPEKKTSSLAFVVQKHDARRLHYDVRLEIDGAMASWAVPKGPSYDPKVRRLAVQTEDHPMSYNDFEGRIPDREYGAGDVLIWDRGTYETVPPAQQRAMMEKGHLHVRFAGEKLVGDWHLIRTGRSGGDDGAGGSGKAQWLMFKAKDAEANPAFDVVAERPESVVSGRQATRGPLRVGASTSGASAASLLTAVGEPALATASGTISNAADWLFEIKYDGYRVLACKAGSEVKMYTRRSNDWTDRFRPIADAVRRLVARECVVDGEACVLDESGRPSFAALQVWLGGGKAAGIAYIAFDLLWLDGRDLRSEPIETRRELLQNLVEGHGAPLSLSRAVEGNLQDLLKAAKKAGLEGLVAKRKGSTYVGGRFSQWLKLRFDLRQDCAVVGWSPLSGAPRSVGALLLAVVDDGKLVFAGRVGTGFDNKTRTSLAKQLASSTRDTAPAERAPRIKDAHWVEPSLVCEVAFTEWTRDGSMRHPRYLGLRLDKAPLDTLRERARGAKIEPSAAASPVSAPPVSAAERPPTRPSEAERPPARPSAVDDRAPKRSRSTPKLANPAKVLFPRNGITKRDIWDYYTAVAPAMLPHLAGRPLTLQRYPDGIDGEEWYQQNVPVKAPDFVQLVDVGPRHGAKQRIVCNDVETLQWLANLAALTIHQWCCHVTPEARTRAAIDEELSKPDYVVLDLDPGDGPWSHLVEVARHVRRLLEALHLESAVKTSGKRGVHVVVPIAHGPSHDQATGFAEQVARAVAKVLPGVATVERMKEKRQGKLYVDYGQNGEGRTIVSPYTIRARDGAVVSTPITWDELDEKLDPTVFTIGTVLTRLDKHGDLFAGALQGAQRLPAV